MDAQRFRTSLDSEPLYTKLYNPRWPHNPEDYTLGMRIDIDPLRIKFVLSQPAPPLQCNSSPRRSPAVGTESDEPGVLRAESQSAKREGIFPFQASVDGFLHVSCTSPKQECILLQLTSSQQAAAHEEFARPSKKQQQQRMTVWTTEQRKQFDLGG